MANFVVGPNLNDEGKVVSWRVTDEANGETTFASKREAVASLPRSGVSVQILKKDGTVQLEVGKARGVRAPKTETTAETPEQHTDRVMAAWRREEGVADPVETETVTLDGGAGDDVIDDEAA